MKEVKCSSLTQYFSIIFCPKNVVPLLWDHRTEIKYINTNIYTRRQTAADLRVAFTYLAAVWTDCLW